MQLVKFRQVDARIKHAKTYIQKMSALTDDYPAFYLAYCKDLGMHEEHNRAVNRYKELRYTYAENYSSYLHGYVIPEIERARNEGKLKKGKWARQT